MNDIEQCLFVDLIYTIHFSPVDLMNLLKIQVFVALTLMPGMAIGQLLNSNDEAISGFSEPYRSIDLAAAEPGTLKEILVKEGDVVEPGVILARLNEDVVLVSLEMAREGNAAKGKLNSAVAELEMQKLRFKKLKGLQTRNHASASEILRARMELDVAKAHVETVTDELKIKALEEKRIRAQLERRRLRSPISGIVTEIRKDEGEFVSPNDPTVLTLVQLDPLLVVFSVPSGQATGIREGNRVPVYIGEANSKTEGIVEFVSPTADAQSGTCRVKVRIANSDHRWFSGEKCRIELRKGAGGQVAQPVSHAGD